MALDGSNFKNSAIEINNPECGLVLFHDASDQFNRIKAVYQAVADIVLGVNFWTLDLTSYRDIARRFANLAVQNSPYKWAQTTSTNFILVYSLGQPQSFYSGGLSVEELTQFALTNVCVVPSTPTAEIQNKPVQTPVPKVEAPIVHLELPDLDKIILV